jgi:hypothetical protein
VVGLSLPKLLLQPSWSLEASTPPLANPSNPSTSPQLNGEPTQDASVPEVGGQLTAESLSIVETEPEGPSDSSLLADDVSTEASVCVEEHSHSSAPFLELEYGLHSFPDSTCAEGMEPPLTDADVKAGARVVDTYAIDSGVGNQDLKREAELNVLLWLVILHLRILAFARLMQHSGHNG